MIDTFVNSVLFGVVLTVAAYLMANFLKSRFKSAIFNPILISLVIIIVFLLVSGIDYQSYNKGAKWISFWLTPATVALAIPLYEQFDILKRNHRAILVGIASGVMASVFSILALVLLFGLGHTEYVTLLPKSITTAIGMGVSEELGGLVPVTVVVIILTGLLGNVTAEYALKLMRIKEPIARGIAIGSSAHALGTAKALELGPIEGAMSSLSIVISGLLTVIVSALLSGLV